MASIVRSSKSPHSFWTRSTIYNRNERRRAKTLANANDTRPPAMRVLAQFTGGATSVAAAATVTTQHSQEASTLSFPFNHPDEDTTVFTTSPPLESLQEEMQQMMQKFNGEIPPEIVQQLQMNREKLINDYISYLYTLYLNQDPGKN